MTDVTVAAEAAPDFIFKITLPGEIEVEVNFSKLADDPAKALIIAGAEAILRKANGMTKLIAGITKATGEDLATRKAKIAEAAKKTLDQLNAGVVPGRAKAVKVSGAEQTEAMRLAKTIVKDLIREKGQKIGAYTAKEITEGAKKVLAANPRLLELARENIAKRAEDAKGNTAIDLKGLFGAKAESDEVKVKPKVAPKKGKKGEGEPLSAKQAGMVAPRAKPGTAHHGTTH